MSAGSANYALWATFLGAFCAASLLIGAMLGAFWKPGRGVTAVLTAFGSGALLAALSVELIAPTVLGLGAASASRGASASLTMIWLIAGCIAGGLIFAVCNHLLNTEGGYLRKVSTTITYLRQRRKLKLARMLSRLHEIVFFRAIPPDHMHRLFAMVRPAHFVVGECLFSEGDPGDRVIFIDCGSVELTAQGRAPKRLGEGDILGASCLLTGAQLFTTAIALTPVDAFELLKEDLDKLRPLVPELDQITARFANMPRDELNRVDMADVPESQSWIKQAMRGLHSHGSPVHHEIQQSAQEHGGAPLAIWLGSVLDGIPESFVVGSGVTAMVLSKTQGQTPPELMSLIPFTLIAGLFLSNLPEAFSSSIGMREQGWKVSRILLLWLSLVLTSALSSYLGYVIGANVSHGTIIFVEGLAAGAMLTMIAQTMIPEAVHLGGGNIVGLSTLAGFVASLAFKLLET